MITSLNLNRDRPYVSAAGVKRKQNRKLGKKIELCFTRVGGVVYTTIVDGARNGAYTAV